MNPSAMTVVFTDLVGSVKMYSKVSDSVAIDLVRKLDREVQDLLAKFEGRFIKSTGDGHLMTFPSPGAAIRCAQEIHGRCDTLARDHKQDLTVRVAAHTGEVFQADNDIHGSTVNLTARLLSVAGACETAVTSETWAGLTDVDRQGYLPHGPEVFKGFTKFTTVHKRPNLNPILDVTVRPEMGDEDTSVLITEQMPKHSRYAVVLEHPQLQKTIVVAEGETHILGRAPECTTQVPDKMFSGSHLALAVVDGILWAFDLQSSNGVLYRGRRIKRRKPIECNTMLQLPTGSLQIKLP